MHRVCIVCAMAYRAGVVGGVRVHGGRAAAAAGRAPRDRGRARHGRLERGRARSATLYPSLRPGVRRPPVRAARRRRPARARPRVLRAAARRVASCCFPRSLDHVGARRRPRRRLPAAARRVPRAGTASRTPRPSSSTASRTGSSSCTATSSPTHAHVAVAGLLPDRGEPRVRAARRARARRAARHRRRRGVGRVGRGPRAEDDEPVLRSERERRARTACSRTATPPRWSRRCRKVARRAGRGAVHAAPRADDARHPRDVLRAAGDAGAVDRAAARALPRVLRRRSVRRRRRRAVGHQGDLRRQRRARHRALRRAHRDRARDRGRGQPREGRVGPDDPGREPPARPARDHRACRLLGSRSRERRPRPTGFVAGGLACGIKESGAPDLAIVATDDRAPVAAAGVFTSNLAQAAPVQISQRAPRRRPRGRGRAQLRQRQRRDRRAGPARRAAHVRAHRRRASASRRPTCSCARPASSASRCRWTRSKPGIPKLCGRSSRRRRRRRGAGDHDHRHRAEGSGRDAPARRPSAGWPRARRCSRPRWRRCSRCSPPTPRSTRRRLQRALAARGRRDVRLPQRRRLPLDERHRARARERPRRRSRRRTRSPTRSPRCAARSPSRWRATPKARPSSCASASSAPAPTPTPASRPAAVANSQLVQCSLNGDDPYWGRVLSELGASGALIDPERVDIAYNGVTVCRDGIACDARRGRARRGDGRARHRDPLRPAPRARRGDGAHHRPVARVHRREPAHVVTAPSSDAAPTERVRDAGEKALDPRRGAAVHPRVLGQDRRHQVRRPRDGRTPSSPTCSRPTSC